MLIKLRGLLIKLKDHQGFGFQVFMSDQDGRPVGEPSSVYGPYKNIAIAKKEMIECCREIRIKHEKRKD